MKDIIEDLDENFWSEIWQVFRKINPIVLMLIWLICILYNGILQKSESLLHQIWVTFLFLGQTFAICLAEYIRMNLALENERSFNARSK